MVLVTGAGLFLVSFERMIRLDTGVDYRRVVSVSVRARTDLSTRDRRDVEMARGASLLRQVREHVAQSPGVEAAAWYYDGAELWSGGRATIPLTVPGRPALPVPTNSANTKTVSPGFFGALGIRLVRGRDFNEMDGLLGGDAVVINDVTAKRFFGDIDVVGKPLLVGRDMRTVVGIAQSVRLDGPEGDLAPEVYRPGNQQATASGTLYVRFAPSALPSADAVRRAIDELHLEVAASDARSLSEAFAGLICPRALNTLIVVVFGVLAIVIAAGGVYGVMSCIVAQRGAEIGIRIALGGRPSQVRRAVMWDASRLIASGAVIGLAAAALLARVVGTFLFHVDPRDPWLYAAATLALIAIALLAAIVPARRASRVNPVDVLRA